MATLLFIFIYNINISLDDNNNTGNTISMYGKTPRKK